MPPAPIPVAVWQIRVELQIVPASRKARPVRQHSELPAHILRGNECKTISINLLAQGIDHVDMRGGCCGGLTTIASNAIALNTAPATKVCGAPN